MMSLHPLKLKNGGCANMTQVIKRHDDTKLGGSRLGLKKAFSVINHVVNTLSADSMNDNGYERCCDAWP